MALTYSDFFNSFIDFAINHDANAEIDDESCYYITISEIVNDPIIGEEVITSGVICDYYKPTNGPHIVSIAENLNGFINKKMQSV